jgi:two-component system, cell cycle sensor histidine kinase and response regulator CckA
VDDEETIITVNRDMLEALGYSVLIARSGREAISIFEKNMGTIDLVILDVIMPDMGGEETFNSLIKLNPSVSVVLSSGYSLEGSTRKILAQGCKSFIQKPFTINTLSQKLREVLGSDN